MLERNVRRERFFSALFLNIAEINQLDRQHPRVSSKLMASSVLKNRAFTFQKSKAEVKAVGLIHSLRSAKIEARVGCGRKNRVLEFLVLGITFFTQIIQCIRFDRNIPSNQSVSSDVKKSSLVIVRNDLQTTTTAWLTLREVCVEIKKKKIMRAHVEEGSGTSRVYDEIMQTPISSTKRYSTLPLAPVQAYTRVYRF